jgi:benzoyl-CoA reductase/2-hydroxyglutaryl-CoA dehydratase subunit BcrC/BadD/HgdB
VYELVNNIEMENRIIPYKMLYEAVISTSSLVNGILPEDGIPSLRIGLNHLKNVMEEYIKKAREGLPIIGHHFSFPTDYLSCFDCIPVCIEAVSYLLAALLPHGSEPYYDLITNWGHPFHTCTSQKGTMGMTLDDLFKFDAIITPTAPCDNTYASYPFFSYHKKIPLITPDLPFLKEEKSYHYHGEQIKLGIERLGEIISQETDYNKLRAAIEIENRVAKLQLEIFELKKAKPCPVENMFNVMAAAAAIYFSGRNEKLNFYNDMLELAKSRYKNKTYHAGEEKIRSIWPYMIIFFDLELGEWLNRHLGMSILFDIFNYNFSEPINTKSDIDTMYYGMAKKAMEAPMVKQSAEFYYSFLDQCVQLAKDYSADCFIFTSHIGCKQFGSVPQLLREVLRDEVGIPMLLIDVDVGDARFASEKIIREKIKMFAQTLM